MNNKLTQWGVLALLKQLPYGMNRSTYIRDALRKQGHSISSAALLLLLRTLECDGYIERNGGQRGFYGFEWTLTEQGKKFP